MSYQLDSTLIDVTHTALEKWTNFLTNYNNVRYLLDEAEKEPTNTRITTTIIYDLLNAKTSMLHARNEIARSLAQTDEIMMLNVGRLIREGELPFLERLESTERPTRPHTPYPTVHLPFPIPY